MWKDPIVEELHAVRAQMLRDVGGDMHALDERVRAEQSRHPERVLPFVPRGLPLAYPSQSPPAKVIAQVAE